MELLGYNVQSMHIIIILVGLILTYVGYTHFMKKETDSQTITESEEVLKPTAFESNKEIIMYGKDSCPWCEKQKTELGDLFDNVKYIDCENNECDNVDALPTWNIDGEVTEGFITKQEFLQKCET